MRFDRRFVLAAAILAPTAAGAWIWTTRSPAPEGTVFTENGVAIRGFDPVAYFRAGQPVAGSPEHSASWQGAVWHFATAENRALFVADPARYAPQYGGFCAWAVATKDSAYPIDPAAWRIVDGRLYLNFDQRIQSLWQEDIPGFIAAADDNWPGLKARLADSV